jgi:hypothetical protein
MELNRIGGEVDALSQRAEHGPGMTPCHREILADGQDGTPCWVGEGSVVHVLADVLFIETHEAVMG